LSLIWITFPTHIYITPAPNQPDQQLRETRKKDAKALFLIQSALDDEIFPRIVEVSTCNQA